MSRIGLILVFLLVGLLVVMGCAPGNDRWDPYLTPGNEAGFWAGVWHGLIVVITFVVSLFTDEVGLYEVNNTGWPYNLGFLVGLMFSIGGGIRHVRSRRHPRRRDWERIGREIEEKVEAGFKEWLGEAEEEKKREWEEIGKKVEEKIRKVLKEWLEEE